ncbi:nucleotide exchange factor GrpE [Singulisphaera acidiphila]|uniref:Molecular chaperone GrpE (Heat shock protein) n=1 Tax=Singulisphaera acidiphila (strain ATCC BAA-1392 / DSM 18658 / VKM B-2454 / MOB10) TaxID=886293 RepID=L0DBE3_SINAD|nr:nucleotide exchange factor GrpE [Singulisphaera acidiphila]AGA26180.1 molecular chaperone GrpE (heat shock protein) [Singulisphaera acidiphila DSM 18658]
MADELEPENDLILAALPEPLVSEEIAQEIAFVIPAAVYESIDTEDELAQPAEPIADQKESSDSLTLPAIAALGETLHRKLDTLQTLFEREIRAEATREKVVDRLHAELQEYKQGLLLNVLRPIFVDLIQLHDDIGKIAEAQGEGDGNGEASRYLGLMRGFQQGIEDILYRQGVEPYLQEGESFDPRRQRAVATVVTEDAALNKQIAARHRKGFQAGDRVIRAEIVSVYALKK